MFLQDWLVIIGCVQLLLAGPSKADSCTFSINSTFVKPSCLSVSINDCQCTIQEISPCGSRELYCYTCCQNWLQSCHSYSVHLNEDGQFSNVTIQFKDLIGWKIDSASCSLKRTIQQSSTLGQTSSVSLSPEAIIGGVVGGVGGLILIAAITIIAIVLYRRRRKSLSNSNRTLANSTSEEGKQINDYVRPNRVVSILPAPFTQSDISPNEQSVNPPPFNPDVEPNSYDNNYPIVAPEANSDTNETTVVDNQFYTHNQGETVTMATDHLSDDTTLVDNQFYAGNPNETVTMTADDTTVFDNSFYGSNPVDTTTTGYDNVGRR